MKDDLPAGPPAEAPSDEVLLAAARRGEPSAIEALLVRYQPRVYRFGLRMCGNPEDASDIAQESLFSMARSLGDFRGESSVSTWLYTIARRFCLRKRRRSKFAPPGEDSLDGPGSDTSRHLSDPSPNPEQAAANRELEVALTQAIDALDPDQREVLVLRDVEGLTAPEVAAILNLSVDAVKSRLHRARVAVRHALAPVLDASMPIVPPKPGCPNILTLFSQHLEGDIDQSACARMEEHLVRCPHCRGVCGSLKRTLAACRQLPAPEVPASLAESIRTGIQGLLTQR